MFIKFLKVDRNVDSLFESVNEKCSYSFGLQIAGMYRSGSTERIHDVVSMTYGFKRRCHCVVEEECYC